MTYWRGGGASLWGNDDRSTITQPPVLGTATWLVYEATRELAMLQTLYPRLSAYHEWFMRRRDPDGDHLVSILHPWESWDASPRWDGPLGLERFTHEGARQARLALAARILEADGDASALARDGAFFVEPIDINAIRAADLEALSRIAHELDRPEEAQRWQSLAEAVQQAVSKKLLRDAPADLQGTDEAPIRVDSASDFVALFGGCATPQQAEQLIRRLGAPGYWTPFPVPTTPITSEHFAPELYWRGNVWLPVNWLIYVGLRRYGFHDLATDLVARSLRLIEENGFWEYYHPITGQGLGARDQSWSTLVLDLLAQEQGRDHPTAP
jgi:hypothetical protein